MPALLLTETRNLRRLFRGICALLCVALLVGCPDSPPIADSSSPTARVPTPSASRPTETDLPSSESEPSPIEEATPDPETFATIGGDGTYEVGVDISPGTYRTREPSEGCYWARLADFDGGLEGIQANENTNGPTVVTISKKDKGFETSNCATWTKDLSRITEDPRRFSYGTFIVGTDIKPGTYRSSGGEGCYWARLRDFLGGLNSIAANGLGEGAVIVRIQRGDKGFASNNCGTWERR